MKKSDQKLQKEPFSGLSPVGDKSTEKSAENQSLGLFQRRGAGSVSLDGRLAAARRGQIDT
jgi:hypothetical protein